MTEREREGNRKLKQARKGCWEKCGRGRGRERELENAAAESDESNWQEKSYNTVYCLYVYED